ncbi:hypothetical protein EFP84_04715 [Leptospira kmetyi]|uniref:Uncharacterized protein n=1 Tax=Leptospira kmetyi TaxID=408139 RepID=A0AAD0UNT3_9LEPT|nr:hypothetical protein [Leptospira kmetyi]AYV54885.1 hypothetical protein EFP84_04715 [Leptospira kmetyi]
MNYQRLEKIGTISSYIALVQMALLILSIYIPGLKGGWLEKYALPMLGLSFIFFGSLFLSTTLGINLIRSGELEISHIFVSTPVPKPIARLIGCGFLLMGSIGVLLGFILLPFYTINFFLGNL